MPLGPEHGLARLPAPSTHDIFLDLEGDRLAPNGGREYLFGLLVADDAARRPGAPPPPLVYLAPWATTPEEEKKGFELVVDLILATFRAHPDVHVYHFGAYEPSTFKRLSGRYATRETELDTILRAELFVDLYTIVRHALKASVESYSIKDLERFYGFVRMQDLRAATASRHAVEWAIEMREDLGFGERAAADAQLELFDANAPPPNPLVAHVAAVELYNREDCVSAEKLRGWLERLRTGAERAHDIELPRPQLKSGEANERIAATAEETQRVLQELIAGVPVDEAERSPEQHARWLMAHLLEWHRREDKAAWWEYYRLRDLPLEDYEEERSALAGLTFVGTVGGTARVPVNRYSFPAQDHDIRRRDEACVPPDGDGLGEVVAVDVGAHTIDIQQKGNRANERPERIFVKRQVPSGTKPAVLLEIGRWIAANGIDGPGEHRAARDLLLRRPPRFITGSSGLAQDGAKRTDVASGAPGSNDEPRGREQRVISFAAARSAREQRLAATVGGQHKDVDPEVVQARRLGFELDRSVLPIQGPPGTGKTFTGSHMILELLKAGKKVGVTAVGHETIRHLLRGVCERAAEQQIADFKCLHKGESGAGDPEELHSRRRQRTRGALLPRRVRAARRDVVALGTARVSRQRRRSVHRRGRADVARGRARRVRRREEPRAARRSAATRAAAASEPPARHARVRARAFAGRRENHSARSRSVPASDASAAIRTFADSRPKCSTRTGSRRCRAWRIRRCSRPRARSPRSSAARGSCTCRSSTTAIKAALRRKWPRSKRWSLSSCAAAYVGATRRGKRLRSSVAI